MKILLLIKDPFLLEAMAVTLETQDYSVVRTATSEEALPLASTLEIDLLVVSLNVQPEGAEPIVQLFRARHPQLPVLLVTGSCSNLCMERARQIRATLWYTGSSSGSGSFLKAVRSTLPTER